MQYSDVILGAASLVYIDHMNRSAEFYVMIGNTENYGRSIGTFAVETMLNHAFYHTNLHRIKLAVLDDSERAKHLYEKCGFQYEGRKRKAYFKSGKFVDMLY